MEKQLLNNKYFIKDDFRLEINGVSEIPPHTHDFIEFVYMLKGSSVHNVDGKKYSMSSGNLLIMNYNQIHSFNGDPTAKFCNILIKPSFVDKAFLEYNDLFLLFEDSDFYEFKNLINKNCNFITFTPEEKEKFEYIIFMLEEELEKKQVGFSILVKSGINMLLTMIFRKMSESILSDASDFQRVLGYIEKNYSQNISIKDLSKICNYNPSYFSRLFKKYTGSTFSEYLKRVRIINACKLLRDRKTTITQLYGMVGYTNQTNFYKHFKEVIGCTPLKYRKSGFSNSAL